jgi:hypothetical protein
MTILSCSRTNVALAGLTIPTTDPGCKRLGFNNGLRAALANFGGEANTEEVAAKLMRKLRRLIIRNYCYRK